MVRHFAHGLAVNTVGDLHARIYLKIEKFRVIGHPSREG